MAKRPKNKQSLKNKKDKEDISDLYVVYTDGSANNTQPSRPAGSAFVIINPSTEEVLHKYSQGFLGLTNNQAELHAIISSIEALPNNCRCCIFTDSKYCIYVLDHKTCDFDKNMEYISQFRYLVETKNIKYQFQWIKGHSGDKWNEIVDSMANQAFMEMGGRLIDYKKFKTDSAYKVEELIKSKCLTAFIEVAKDYIPLQHYDSFIKDINLKFKDL